MLINTMPWYNIDVMIFAIPVSAIVLVVVSLLTQPMDEKILNRSFKGLDNGGK